MSPGEILVFRPIGALFSGLKNPAQTARLSRGGWQNSGPEGRPVELAVFKGPKASAPSGGMGRGREPASGLPRREFDAAPRDAKIRIGMLSQASAALQPGLSSPLPHPAEPCLDTMRGRRARICADFCRELPCIGGQCKKVEEGKDGEGWSNNEKSRAATANLGPFARFVQPSTGHTILLFFAFLSGAPPSPPGSILLLFAFILANN
jgi:hypothetical protein